VNFGASDMLVVKNPEALGFKSQYIPFILGDFVKEVKLADKIIRVDWDLVL
jgi:ribosomal 30S subunit maturation factor RimM